MKAPGNSFISGIFFISLSKKGNGWRVFFQDYDKEGKDEKEFDLRIFYWGCISLANFYSANR